MTRDEKIAVNLACAAVTRNSESAEASCRERLYSELVSVPRSNALNLLTLDETLHLGAICAQAQARGPAELRRCQSREIDALLASRWNTSEPELADEDAGRMPNLVPAPPDDENRKVVDVVTPEQARTGEKLPTRTPKAVGSTGKSTMKADREKGGTTQKIKPPIQGPPLPKPDRHVASIDSPLQVQGAGSGAPVEPPRPVVVPPPQDVASVHAADAVWAVMGRDSQDPEGQHFQGSAVAIGKHTLLTNCDVVRDKSLITISKGAAQYRAKLAATHEPDRCIIQTQDLDLGATASIRSVSTLRPGDEVYGLAARPGKAPAVSNTRVASITSISGVIYIQTTAPAGFGSSGEGIFDSDGNLIAIRTITIHNGSINFAVAAETYPAS